MCARLFSWGVRTMSEAGCDTTTSNMLVFVCSAVCANSQFGRKPTMIPFLKLVLAGGWETVLFTQHSHRWIPKFTYHPGLRLLWTGEKCNKLITIPHIVYYVTHNSHILHRHELNPIFVYLLLMESIFQNDPLYPQDEHLHRCRHFFLSSHTTPEPGNCHLHAIHLSILWFSLLHEAGFLESSKLKCYIGIHISFHTEIQCMFMFCCADTWGTPSWLEWLAGCLIPSASKFHQLIHLSVCMSLLHVNEWVSRHIKKDSRKSTATFHGL